jgi:galactosylceramide sulfotransferase/galactose-3-O-sulfotransferase 2
LHYRCFRSIDNDEFSERDPDEIPQMRTNILFLKTHKTGSSTLQNILLRFGLRYSLNVMLPGVGNYIGYDRPLDETSFDRYLKPPFDGKFNIFACHSRYHPNTMKFMHENTIRVTLLRSPPEYFESLYNFFSLNAKYNATFDELVRSLSTNASVVFVRDSSRSKSVNQMCYELGLQRAFVDEPSDTVIGDFIRYVDREFDFVMITEYFDECLVLLADLMGWPLRTVTYLPLMARPDARKTNATSRAEDRAKIRELNKCDSSLYDYFLEKLRQRTLQYGEERLIERVRTLRRMNERLYAKCISGETRNGYGGTVAYTLKSDADWECVHVAKGELALIDEIRRQQIERFERDRKFLDLISS